MNVFSNKSKGQVVLPAAEAEPSPDGFEKAANKEKESADPLDGLKIASNKDELLKSLAESLREQLVEYKKKNS